LSKNWQIILISLCLQALFGSLLLSSASDHFHGQHGGIIFLFIYVSTAIGLILLFFLTFLSMRKHYPGLAVRGTLTGIGVWLLIPFLYKYVQNHVREQEDPEQAVRKHARIYEAARKEGTLAAARQMGLSPYSWSSVHHSLEITTDRGIRHWLVVQDNRLSAYCNPEPLPDKKDTLAWLHMILEEASVYLDPGAHRRFDSCIRTKQYEFRYLDRQDAPEFSIKVYIPSRYTPDRSNLTGDFQSVAYGPPGTLNLSMRFDTLARKTAAF
jgi:hypothetical protein